MVAGTLRVDRLTGYDTLGYGRTSSASMLKILFSIAIHCDILKEELCHQNPSILTSAYFVLLKVLISDCTEFREKLEVNLYEDECSATVATISFIERKFRLTIIDLNYEKLLIEEEEAILRKSKRRRQY
ncbi:hypothetical protein EJB05_15736 [Eragrostis curvula]|uniref:Uncharacterized protein n=1 Tax=Eragrostis curvula TaxID=38414 RepID=A0A5J9VGA8_9POAL|nr:hypothetical protein EJB05_15736 [Eragrostis curvula]